MAKVALLVGVSEYEPGLNPLPGSVKDVDAMQRVLVHPEMGGFAEADITVLKNPQRQAMEDAIYSLFSGRKKDDLLLFYFSGHGIKDENGRLYLATRATRKDSNGSLVPPSAVAAASLHENINASRSQRQVMILDCCFSGAIAQGMTVKDDGTVNLKDYLGGKGRAILTSSTSTEYSFGSATPGHEDEGLSIYTRYLVEGIEKGAADTDGDGWIAVEELHEYAANRVKEAAPAMTPKFYPVEEGYKIVLARSRKDDPKLKYRKEAQARAEQGQGQFSIIAQKLLRDKRIEWGISAEEAKAIENEVLQPYREYELKQQEYEQALAEVAKAGYPLSATMEAELKEYQQHLGLRDSDIAAIEARTLAPLRAQVTQQSAAAYQQKLGQYEQALINAIQREFPFTQQIRQASENLQQSLGLRDEDIIRIEQPLIQQAELRHQEKLRQEAEQQRQEQEKAEYENKLRRYEQKFAKAIQAEYPLNQSASDGLKAFQQQLELKDEDVIRVEQPIREPAEAKYQENLKQQAEAERQRQIELEQRRQTEKQRKQAEAQKAQPSPTSPKPIQTQTVISKPTDDISIQTFDFETATLTVIEKAGWFGSKNSVEIKRSRGRARYFTENLGNDVTLEMVEIPAGEFLMGTVDAAATSDEGPQHRVQLPTFWVGRFAVTQAQWRQVAGLPKVKHYLNPDTSCFKGAKRPVETVSWEEAMEFCDRLSHKIGRPYRLPSEAEWEYACRAGTTTPFHFGETITSDLVNCNGNFPYGNAPKGEYREQTTDVGIFPPNGFGLHDMHGNVREWCADLRHGSYQGAPTDGSVWTTDGYDESRVIRGGSWGNNPVYCRSAYRSSFYPRVASSTFGFRVVCRSPRTHK